MKSWIEISAARLRANYAAIRTAAGSDVETLAVIKANAYGHDAVLCGRILVREGAKWVGVADVGEAIRLRAEPEFAAIRILLMSAVEPADVAAVVAHNLTPVVWTVEQINALEQAATAARTRIAVHLEIDTGMARQGARGEELATTIRRLAAASSWLQLEGVMTHLACAEVAGSAITATQRELFAQSSCEIAEAGLKPRYLHVVNSSGIDERSTLPWLRHLADQWNVTPMVRAGIALYGYILPLVDPRDEQGEGSSLQVALAHQLQPILTWKTHILDVRQVPAGATVGYSASFTALEPMKIALLPVGYADGFRRAASSGPPPDWQRGWVLIHGQRAPVVGRVSMNLTTVDVTAIDEVSAGDEVVLLGDGVTANDHASWAGTISYEILCGIRSQPRLV